jgi:hypothetical protein
MKVIEVPAAVTVKPVGDGKGESKEIPFKEFVGVHIDTYAQAKTAKQFRQLAKIHDALEAANGTVTLEDADYELMKAALEEGKYFPGISRQLITYYDAIDKAQDVKK